MKGEGEKSLKVINGSAIWTDGLIPALARTLLLINYKSDLIISVIEKVKVV